MKNHEIKFHFLLIIMLMVFTSGLNAQECLLRTTPDTDQSNNIRNYLMKEAYEISQSALCHVNSLEDWQAVKNERYDELIESLGLIDVPLLGERPDLNVKITGTIEQEGFRIEKLYYESLPSLYVVANLYIPDNVQKPRPAILYLCGHASGQKVAYQGYARKFARLGFVCLIVETTHQGEVEGEHHGCYARGWFNWYSRGFTPAGVEVWNAIRGLDLLSQRKEVDPARLGITGRSGGGAQTWFVAAVDKRVKAAAPGVGATTLNEQILTRTLDGHCDCMVPINTYQRDFQEIGALIAPRPLFIDQGDRDRITNIEGVRQMYLDINKIYGYYKKPENIKFIEYQGGHGSTTYSRQQMYSFFLEQLMGETLSPDEIGDADFSSKTNLSADALRVFVDGPPKDDRTTDIQNTFFDLATKPVIETIEDLSAHRDNVVNYLQTRSFGSFPENPAPLDPHLLFRSADKDEYGSDIYSFVPEEGWRLRIDIRWKHKPEEKKPMLIVLKQKGDGYSTAEEFADGLGEGWNVAYVNLRGIDQASWEPGLQWHVRRASAWTGRTIASMQVYDLIRCLEFCRSLEDIDPDRISIAARDDLGVVALYTALLDNNIEELILRDPPESQDHPSRPDGTGPAVEILNSLRVTDLWQIPAYLPETKILFIDKIPEAYKWSEDIRKKLGKSRFSTIESHN